MEWRAVPPEEPGELAWSPEQRLGRPYFPLCCDRVQEFFFILGTSLFLVAGRQRVADTALPRSEARAERGPESHHVFRVTELLVLEQRETNCLWVTLLTFRATSPTDSSLDKHIYRHTILLISGGSAGQMQVGDWFK